MADTDVGKEGTYHAESGDVPCWVLAYEAGREKGDHQIAGFKAGAGEDTFKKWTVVGTEKGAFSVS